MAVFPRVRTDRTNEEVDNRSLGMKISNLGHHRQTEQASIHVHIDRSAGSVNYIVVTPQRFERYLDRDQSATIRTLAMNQMEGGLDDLAWSVTTDARSSWNAFCFEKQAWCTRMAAESGLFDCAIASSRACASVEEARENKPSSA